MRISVIDSIKPIKQRKSKANLDGGGYAIPETLKPNRDNASKSCWNLINTSYIFIADWGRIMKIKIYSFWILMIYIALRS